jgi:hypothetical protein
MTLTDKGYAEAIAALKQGAQVTTLYWCDGSTPCAIKAEPHGHWRGGYNVDAGEVMRRLLDENERLRVALGEAEYAVTTLRAEMQRLVDWAEAETANNEPEDPAHPHRAHSRVRAARSVLKGTGKP